MRKNPGPGIAIVLWLCLSSITGHPQTKDDSLVLVSSSSTELESLSHADVRKLFLGIPIIKDNIRLLPVLNTGDPLMTEIFLQKIIFMSKRDYERQLVSRVFRSGGQRPAEYDNADELVEKLISTPGSVSFMWATQLEQHKDLRSLGQLWSSSND